MCCSCRVIPNGRLTYHTKSIITMQPESRLRGVKGIRSARWPFEKQLPDAAGRAPRNGRTNPTINRVWNISNYIDAIMPSAIERFSFSRFALFTPRKVAAFRRRDCVGFYSSTQPTGLSNITRKLWRINTLL
jgi:hypothetical protein